MVNRDIGGLVLMATYLATVVVGEIGVYLIGRVVEARAPTWSLISFLTMFMAVLILAWPLALRMTRAYGEPDPV